MQSSPGEVSYLIASLEKRDANIASRLLAIVYSELRRLAAHYMREERCGQTIQPTELVHEAWLRLIGNNQIEWQGRAHFLAMAATSMRRIREVESRSAMPVCSGVNKESPTKQTRIRLRIFRLLYVICSPFG